MSGDREQVIADIRRGLNRTGPLPDGVVKALDARLKRPSPNLKPAISEDLLALFIARMQAVNGATTRVAIISAISVPIVAALNPSPSMYSVQYGMNTPTAAKNRK